MPKRFTATEKWDDPWFRRLSPDFKSLWIFLCERCDHAGIWKVDLDLFVFYVGRSFTKDEVFTVFNTGKVRIKEINCGSKWYLTTFVYFQYGELSDSSSIHRSVKSILEKERVATGLPRGGDTPKDKEKVKDKETVSNVRNKDNVNIINSNSIGNCNKERKLTEPQQVLDVFVKEHLKARGIPYIVSGAKDIQIIKGMLYSTTVADLCARIPMFFESTDEFVRKGGFGIPFFSSVVNKFGPKPKNAIERRIDELARSDAERDQNALKVPVAIGATPLAGQSKVPA